MQRNISISATVSSRPIRSAKNRTDRFGSLDSNKILVKLLMGSMTLGRIPSGVDSSFSGHFQLPRIDSPMPSIVGYYSSSLFTAFRFAFQMD